MRSLVQVVDNLDYDSFATVAFQVGCCIASVAFAVACICCGLHWVCVHLHTSTTTSVWSSRSWWEH
jgi:hypothetical protein